MFAGHEIHYLWNNLNQRTLPQKMIMNRLTLLYSTLQALPKKHVTLFLSLTQMLVKRKRRQGRSAKSWLYGQHCPESQSRLGHSIVCSCLCCRGQPEKKTTTTENHNKKTTKCSPNPAVNESGSLQQFFYALSIPQRDKHNAEPALSATSPTPLHCEHCGLPHFMSVNPFKPTGNYSCPSGQEGFRVT